MNIFLWIALIIAYCLGAITAITIIFDIVKHIRTIIAYKLEHNYNNYGDYRNAIRVLIMYAINFMVISFVIGAYIQTGGF